MKSKSKGIVDLDVYCPVCDEKQVRPDYLEKIGQIQKNHSKKHKRRVRSGKELSKLFGMSMGALR